MKMKKFWLKANPLQPLPIKRIHLMVPHARGRGVGACFKVITLGIFLVFLLQFEPLDGRVCRATCPTLASCTHVLFGVHVHVNSA